MKNGPFLEHEIQEQNDSNWKWNIQQCNILLFDHDSYVYGIGALFTHVSFTGVGGNVCFSQLCLSYLRNLHVMKYMPRCRHCIYK